MKQTPEKVTVLLSTYSHEKFIVQAIQSVLIQDVDFNYEIVIVEDCSTDRTTHLVLDFRDQYPKKIRLVLADRNRNDTARGNAYLRCIDSLPCSVRRRRLLDIDSEITKTGRFHGGSPECSICFHNALAVYDDGSRPSYDFNPPEQAEFSMLEDLWHGNFAQRW